MTRAIGLPTPVIYPPFPRPPSLGADRKMGAGSFLEARVVSTNPEHLYANGSDAEETVFGDFGGGGGLKLLFLLPKILVTHMQPFADMHGVSYTQPVSG
jgi:hypothetical protein